MNLVTNNDIAVDLWKIIAHHGYPNQKGKAIEELNELSEAIARDLQGHGDRDNITEEMADVYVMLAQLQLIYGNHDGVARCVRDKLARTLDAIDAEIKGLGIRD